MGSDSQEAKSKLSKVVEEARKSGPQVITVPTADSMLAAVARNNGLTVVTKNEKDFNRMGVAVLNPWIAG